MKNWWNKIKYIYIYIHYITLLLEEQYAVASAWTRWRCWKPLAEWKFQLGGFELRSGEHWTILESLGSGFFWILTIGMFWICVSCGDGLNHTGFLWWLKALLEVCSSPLLTTLLDRGCGKSLTSLIMSTRYPQLAVSALDRIGPEGIPHYKEAGLQVRRPWGKYNGKCPSRSVGKFGWLLMPLALVPSK